VPVGERIRALRTARKLTQEQLAYRAGVSVGTIARIERGATRPTLETLERLARALDVSVADLLGERGSDQV